MKHICLTRWMFDEGEMANTHAVARAVDNGALPGVTCLETLSPDVNGDGIPDNDLAVVIVTTTTDLAGPLASLPDTMVLPPYPLDMPAAEIPPQVILACRAYLAGLGITLDITGCRTCGEVLQALVGLTAKQWRHVFNDEDIR